LLRIELALLLQRSVYRGINRMDKRVEKIIEMMRDDVRGELSLAEFAQSVNLSVWRLCHIFKSDVGLPPIKYLRLLRMERARGLLESSFLSVKEIAFQVGLNDESHFVRDFKSTYGFSPATYRSHFRHNGNGHGVDQAHTASQVGKMGQQLARAAKQSVLPSLHLFVYVVANF
jgi:transcriptional regulator GlxA family with amidase domain